MATIAKLRAHLKALGWTPFTEEVPDAVFESLEAGSHERKELNKESVLRYVSCWYDGYHKDGRYMLITDGAEFVTVNAEAMLVASPLPDIPHDNTVFFTIGGGDKCGLEWMVWAAEGGDPEKRPDRGFNYVS
ncbi:hypothetical protein [Marinobacter shengliensis]|uniref:hypothetical protein n=1 Tax=Marinobacter shengliensis TaxID=1389223 RepID=UPI001108C9BE|nr:hypothetical protein [Marinobacter shengliensis]